MPESHVPLSEIKLKPTKELLFPARTLNRRMGKMFSELLFDVTLFLVLKP